MLIVGLASTQLAAHEHELLAAAQVSGVILFARNFANIAQLRDLVAQLRAVRGKDFLVCVDQEGGPVQRIVGEGVARLPALAGIGALYQRDRVAALETAHAHAWQMASTLRALDIDLSFAPVADLGRGNLAIGLRAFHADPEVVAALVTSYIEGMHAAGMAATLKHFPGHGSVRADTHHAAAVDPRPLAEIESQDLPPFRAGIAAGAEAVMMAHVSYSGVDPDPAGYSARWIRQVLRETLGFDGIVFSDDIAMVAAESVGDVSARIKAHLEAGCDLVLACTPEAAAAAVAACRGLEPCAPSRLQGLLGGPAPAWPALLDTPAYQAAAACVARLDATTGDLA